MTTINTTTATNPFVDNRSHWMSGFWTKCDSGKWVWFNVRYNAEKQKVLAVEDEGIHTFVMFSTVGLTPLEIALYYVDIVQGCYAGTVQNPCQRYNGVRSLTERVYERERKFEQTLNHSGYRIVGNKNFNVKDIAEGFYPSDEIPSFTKVKDADLSDYWYPTSRYGNAGASDEGTISVHSIKGDSDHKIVTMGYYNYDLDKVIKRYIVVDSSGDMVSEHITMKDAKHKVALLEWDKAHSKVA